MGGVRRTRPAGREKENMEAQEDSEARGARQDVMQDEEDERVQVAPDMVAGGSYHHGHVRPGREERGRSNGRRAAAAQRGKERERN